MLVKRFGFDVGQIAALFVLNNTINALSLAAISFMRLPARG